VSFEFVFTDVHFHRQRQRRVRRLLVMGNVIMVTCCAAWLAIAIAIPLWPIAAVDVVGIFACGILAVVLRRRGLRMARHLFLMTVLAFLLAIMALEPTAPGYPPIVHLYLVVVAVAAYLLLFDAPPRVPAAYAAVCFVIFVGREFGWLGVPPILPFDESTYVMARDITFIGFFAILLVVTRLFVIDIDDAARQFEFANQRLQAMLENMLPDGVAARLSAEGHGFADAFPSCSVLYADIVGFTRMSAGKSPEAIVTLLNDVFSRFDDLVDEAGVEKIKTVGDAYMVAAGVPRPRADHAVALVSLAFRMRDAAAGLGLALRIGVNTGPLVAGLIGRTRFIYDLWGDAVSLATQTETACEPGGIEITQMTLRELGGRFAATPRPAVRRPGGAEVAVYVVTGPAETR
jgi:class 3 adenylate cyclase